MRTIIQRVKYAKITIDHELTKEIGEGLVVFVGIENEDEEEDIEWLSKKIINLRIFSDEADKMNLSIKDIGGELMIVSQFTLHASTKKGNRPSWINAANPEIAKPMYEKFVSIIQEGQSKQVITGKFGAHMDIELLNDGPVTIFMDSKRRE